jgi:hypothetical protein
MQRRLPLVGLFALVLFTGLVLAALGSRPHQEPVYGVSALRAHLEQDPAAWLNRPLRIRAVAERCAAWVGTPGTPCLDAQPTFLDAQAADSASYLRLGWASPSSLRAVLRRLPAIGRLIPAAPPIRWGIPAVYNAELVALFPAGPSIPGDYEALLLDAAP